MELVSLDPRVNRLQISTHTDAQKTYSENQFETYQVFLEKKEGKPFEDVGIVHAPNDDMAFLYAKEQFSRRGTCFGMWVCSTRKVLETRFTDNKQSVYDALDVITSKEGDTAYEIFHLYKRGKQHFHAGTVTAADHESALAIAKSTLNDGKPVLNAWIIAKDDFLKIEDDFKDIWSTLPLKGHREVMAYKGADKIKAFKDQNNQLS